MAKIRFLDQVPIGVFETPTSTTNGAFSGSFTGSLFGTASWSIYSLTASYVSGSVANAVSASYALTASYALNGGSGGSNISGAQYFVPLFNSTSSLVTSSIYQSGSYTSIRNSTGPEDPTNPDILYVSGDGVDTYNLISAHGNLDSYVQVNVQNYNTGSGASSDIVATADDGDETTGYIDMGINSSLYTASNFVGSAKDAYIYSTGNDLYIGNATPNKEVILFNGGLDAINNARIHIHDQGTIGINTNQYDILNPPSLQIQAPNTTTTNLVQITGETDNFIQVAISNTNGGGNASADLALYNDLDPNQLDGYIDVGINSVNYIPNDTYPGGPGDAYIFTSANHFHIGTINNEPIELFISGAGDNTLGRLYLSPDNNHWMSGSFTVTQGVTSSLLGTASWAEQSISSSYALTASYSLNAITSSYALNALSSSYSDTASYAFNSISSSYASTASYVLNAVSSSYSDTSSYSFNSVSSSYATTASYVLNAVSASFASTASYLNTLNQDLTFNGNLILNGTASITYLNTVFETASVIYSSGSNQFGDAVNDTQILIGRTIVSGSFEVTGSTNIPSLTGSLLGTASYADTTLSASYTNNATSASYSLTASYFSGSTLNATSASYASTASYVLNAISSSFAATASYFSGSISSAVSASYASTASYVTLAQTASYVLQAVSSSFASTASIATSSSYALTASYVANASSFPYTGSAVITGSLIVTGTIALGDPTAPAVYTSIKTTVNSGSTVIYNVLTSSYDSAFFDYSLKGSSGARAGNIMAIWSGSSVSYTDNSTADMGNTTDFVFGIILSGSNMVLTGSTSTNGWTLKTAIRTI